MGDLVYAKWLINPDGYYPECSICMYEPDRDIVELPTVCPRCGATMLNAEELNKS